MRFTDILRKFDKRFGSAAPDVAHQHNFQSAVQNSGESLRQWSDRVLTLATRAFPQLPDVHTQAIPRLCYGAEDREAGLYALDGQPKTVDEAVDRMQFYQHSRRSRPPCASYHAMRSLVVGEESSKRDEKAESQIQELKSRVQHLEKTLKEVIDSVRLGIQTTCLPRWQPGPKSSRCFGCGKTGHFRRECPAIPRRRTEGSAGEVVDRSLPSRGACQAVADDETKTCGLAPSRQFRTVCLLTQDEEASLRKHPAGEGDSPLSQHKAHEDA